MMSNYPPGVDGNHPHIAGCPVDLADLTDEEIEELPADIRSNAIDTRPDPYRDED